MDDPVLVYTTWPSAAEAEAAGRALVEQRLAACVNILPGMVSIYAWQGAVERADEAVMIVKTRQALAGQVAEAVRARHPYAVPAILVLPTLSVDADYAAWIAAETAAP
jgi:periplasmic divalent cation tolerance protein